MTRRFAWCLLFWTFGCARGDGAGAGSGPRIVEHERIDLQETDSTFLSFPTGSVVSATGELLVGDGVSGRILVFSPEGQLLRVLGRRGQGPGEFLVPGAMVFAPEGHLLVTDWQNERLSRLSWPEGTYRASSQLGGFAYSAARLGDTVVYGLLGRSPLTAVGALYPAFDTVYRSGTAPLGYHASPAIRTVHPYVSVAPTAGHILYGFTGSNFLYDSIGHSPIQQLVIPHRERRLLPDDLGARLTPQLSDSQIAGMASTLTSMVTLAQGRIALVHSDVVLQRSLLTMSSWISVVDVLKRRACVDARLTHGDAGKPIFTAKADTLLVIEQVMADSGRAHTQVRRLTLDTDDCEWLPIEGGIVAP